MDNDRLTKISPLFEKKITVKNILNSIDNNNSMTLILDMDKFVTRIGSLYFGVRYLPTSQKLTVNVIKAKKLKVNDALLEFCKNPFSLPFPPLRPALLAPPPYLLNVMKIFFSFSPGSPHIISPFSPLISPACVGVCENHN